ncbi:thioredoxin family protein [Candidatus Gracilibacteria bacterium]|nr:thioredoxin family protein [Candidatus Gracilibacteria bacterium]
MTLLESIEVPMGDPAKDFSLKATDGQRYSLANFADAKLLVVIFMCNHCPYVQKIWHDWVALQEEFEGDVQFVGINPNTANEEYDEETMEKMKEYYERYDMNFPYLEDPDQAVASEYQAQCTPDIFVYGEGRKLVHHRSVTAEVLKALLEGRELEAENSMGCSIKWV